MKKKRPANLVIERRYGMERIYYRVGKGPRIRLAGKMGSPEFEACYGQAVKQYAGPIQLPKKPPKSGIAKAHIVRRLMTCLKTCRSRALKRGWACELDDKWLLEKLSAQQFKCSLTGIQFFSKFDKKTKVHPFTPSIDRINSAEGYTKDNVRIVCFAVNAMMMDWGKDLFDQVVRAYRFAELKRNKISPVTRVSSPSTEKFITKPTT